MTGAVERERDRVVEEDLGAELLCLRLERLHELGALDALDEAGEVLDLGGVHQRAARGDRAGDDERGESGARGVDGGRVPGGAGADDDEIAGFAHGPILSPVHSALTRRSLARSAYLPNRC